MDKLDELKKVQTLCRYCWSPEFQHLAAEEQAKIKAANLGADSYIRLNHVDDSLYGQAIVCDRRDLEDENNFTFAKAKVEDLMFYFPKEETEATRYMICYQRRVKNHSKYLKTEMFHALKAVAELHAFRPKQTVMNFTRMLAESMLPPNSSELLVQAVAKEIYLAATKQNQSGNQSA